MLIFSLDHDETRGFRGRRYLRADQSPGHARAKARGRIAASMASKHQSWCVRTARVSCCSRAYTGWKPPRRLARKTIIGFGVEERKH
jgi:hypothetical protein